MMRRRSSADICDQPAISDRVLRQPTHMPLAWSSWQTLTQGDSKAGPGLRAGDYQVTLRGVLGKCPRPCMQKPPPNRTAALPIRNSIPARTARRGFDADQIADDAADQYG